MEKKTDRDFSQALCSANDVRHVAPSALQQLMETIVQRKRELPEGSYTTQLFRGGNSRISEKVAEESRELLEAASRLDQVRENAEARAHFLYEAGDLVYHMFVLLGYHDVSLEELESEVRRRFGTSGLAEKAARRSK